MSEPDGERVRLSKRVAALAGCSRRDAEQLIASGAVRVDGQAVVLPQERVAPQQAVAIDAELARAAAAPVTLLLHKPPGLAQDQALTTLGQAAQAHHPADGARLLPRHLVHQRCPAPLHAAAAGLLVFSQDPRVLSLFQERGAFVEHEWMVTVAGSAPPLEALIRQARPGERISLSQQAADQAVLRLALKGADPDRPHQLCARAGLAPLAMRRIRIGRVPLAPLRPREWRFLPAPTF